VDLSNDQEYRESLILSCLDTSLNLGFGTTSLSLFIPLYCSMHDFSPFLVYFYEIIAASSSSAAA